MALDFHARPIPTQLGHTVCHSFGGSIAASQNPSAFLFWLGANRDRFALEIRLGTRTDRVQQFSFAGVNRAIEGALTTYEIEVYAIHENDCWDILLSACAEPKRAHGGGFFCEACPPEARRVFADRPALWADHLFEPLLEWVNDSLGGAKWLALYGNPEWGIWAQLLPGDDPSETLRGGGMWLNILARLGRERVKGRIHAPSFCPAAFDVAVPP